jgi:hypothetical protein
MFQPRAEGLSSVVVCDDFEPEYVGREIEIKEV